MDTSAIVIIAILACIIVAAFLVYRSRARVSLKGPLGTGLEIDASNQPPATGGPQAAPTPPQPGVQIEDAKAKRGDIVLDDQTGKGAVGRRLEAGKDILASSALPKQGPKA